MMMFMYHNTIYDMCVHDVNYIHVHGSISLAMLNINIIKPHYVCVLPIPYQCTNL